MRIKSSDIFSGVIERLDASIQRRAWQHAQELALVPGSPERLLNLAVELAGMTRSLEIPVAKKAIVIFAADHGIVEEGVTPQPQEVTGQVVRSMVAGRAPINAIAETVGARLTVVDAGVVGDLSDLVESGKLVENKLARGTNNFARGPAMSREVAIEMLRFGCRYADQLGDMDVIGAGEMGIGNTSSSTAIASIYSLKDPLELAGPGATLPLNHIAHKATVIRRGLEINQPDPEDPVGVLSKVGGLEIAGIAGLMLGAALHHKPFMVDGVICASAAMIATSIVPEVRDYLVLAHASTEPAHRVMAKLLQKEPLLDLGLHLGEGTGVALAMPFLDVAHELFTQVSTLSEVVIPELEQALDRVHLPQSSSLEVVK